MKEDWFDKKLARKFEGFDSNMDFESAWDNIEAARNKNKKRGFAYWPVFFSVLAFGCLAIAVYFIKNEQLIIAKNQTVANTAHVKATPDNEVLLAENKTPVVEIKKEQIQGNTALSLIDFLNGGNTNSNENSNPNANTNSSLTQNFVDQNINLNAVKSKKEQQGNLPTLIKESHGYPNLITSEKPAPEIVEPLSTTSSKQQIPNSILTPTIYVEYLGEKHFVKTIDPKKSRFHWGATFAYGKNFRSLTATSNIKTIWIDSRGQIETPLDAVYAELFLRKYLTKKLFLQSGVGYLQNTARLEENSEMSYSKTLNDQLLEIIIYADGTEEKIYGEKETGFNDNILVTKYIKSRSVLFPVLIGFDFPFNKKTGMSFSAGASISLNTKISGATISDENTSGNFTNLHELGYKKRGLLYGQGSADFYYKINRAWKFSGGVQTIIGINNQVEKGVGFEDKFKFLGARVSVSNTF